MDAQQVTYLRVFVCRISVILCIIVVTMVVAFHSYSNMFPSPRKNRNQNSNWKHEFKI